MATELQMVMDKEQPDTAADIHTLWSSRAAVYGNDHLLMDKLVGIYEGVLPSEFADYFDDEMHVHVINMIRLAWDDLTAMTGKVFPIQVDPDNETAAAKKRAEKQEQIGYGYNRAGRIVGGIEMSSLMKVISWWQVGCGNAVLMTLPDYTHKTPYFTFRDPRTHYPPVGWSPYTQAAPSDALFAYPTTVGELKRRYPAAADEIRQKIERSTFIAGMGPVTRDDNWTVFVGEYYHEDSWIVATLTDQVITLARTDRGDPGHPGIMPVSAFGLYSPSSSKGRSMFADQISVQAAMARMFSQKLDFYDRTLYPLIFHTPLSGSTVRVGPFALNEYNTTGSTVPPKVDTIAPAHQIDADQSMSFALGLSRMLNRNPEQMQGAGQADSAKALEALKNGVTSTIRDQLWPPILESLPTAYSNAAKLDIRLWGNQKKRATGKRRGSAFTVSYVPTTDLRDREDDFALEPGLGLAGYQGTLEIMQLFGAKLISMDTALEQGEWVREVQEERRRIQGDQISDLQFQDLAMRAQNGGLAPGALADLRQRVANGQDLFEALKEMDQAGTLSPPPPPPPDLSALGAGGPGGPELPPGAQPGTAPAASFLNLPTLQALRGGPGPVRQ